MLGVSILSVIVHCYVGCNTGSPDKQALYVLECDTETGAAKIVQSVTNLQGTTYLQIDKDGKHLYSAIGETKDGRKVGSLVRFPLNGWRIGTMERLCELPCEAPCHVSLAPDEKRVAFAAYGSATCGTVGIDGKGLRTFVFPNDEMGPCVDRQQKAYAHQTFYVGCGVGELRSCELGVVDLGCDRIRFFDPETMREAAIPDIRFDPGDGPRHAVFSKDGKFLFVLCELGSCVYSFRCSPSPSTFTFQRLGRWSMLPEEGTDLRTSKAAAIKLTADGEILMASNRGYDSIAFYKVEADGNLSLRNIAKLRGRFPRDFELMPGEKFMVVGHKMSNEIQVYRFDRAACTLEPVGEPIAAWRPLCFKFLKRDSDS